MLIGCFVAGTASRPSTQVVPRRGLRQSRLLATGRDFVEPWIDLTKSVTGGGSTKSPYAELAAKIGKDIYVDVNGWHLYLSDIKAGGDSNLAVALANKLGPEVCMLLQKNHSNPHFSFVLLATHNRPQSLIQPI